MKSFLKLFLASFLSLLAFSIAHTQNFFPLLERTCLNEPLQNELSLSTGLNAQGQVLPYGFGVTDPYWRLANQPTALNCSASDLASLNGNAYIVTFNNLNSGWVIQNGAGVVSPVDAGPIGNLSCANTASNTDPFIFERVFCLTAAADVFIDLSFIGDDELYLELINLNTNTLVFRTDILNYTNPPPAPLTENTSVFLGPGNYALRANLRNVFGGSGFSVLGNIRTASGDALLRNGVAQQVLSCAMPDTLSKDQYYAIPDRSLTICANLDSLNNPANYAFQWFDANGLALNISPQNNQSCYTIDSLNSNTTGIYYCVATDTINNSCVVFPVEALNYVQNSTGTWHVPNQIVVKYRSDITAIEKQAFRDRYQLKLIDSCMCLLDLLELPDSLILKEPDTIIVDPEEKKKRIGEDPDVEGTDDNADANPGGYTLSNFASLDAFEKNNMSLGSAVQRSDLFVVPEEVQNGDSIIVAIIDTGVDYNLPVFNNYRWVNPNPFPEQDADGNCRSCIEGAINGYDFGDMDADPIAVNPHGTYVARGLVDVAERLQGAVGELKLRLMPLKVMDNKGQITLFSVSCATLFSVKHGAMIINMSLGGYGGYQKIVELVLKESDPGKCEPLLITSAGNDSRDISQLINEHYFSSMSDSLLNVISVGAIPKKESNELPYSNTGANISLSITGTTLSEKEPGQGYAMGTSYAAAHASGILAYIFERKDGISALQAKEVLINLATQELQGPSNIANGKGLELYPPNNFDWKQDLDLVLDKIILDSTCSFTFNPCFYIVSTYEAPRGFEPLAAIVYPNPTTGLLIFEYELKKRAPVYLRIMDAKGRIVKQEMRYENSGKSQQSFSLNGEPDGVYFYQIVSNNLINAGKIIKSSQ